MACCLSPHHQRSFFSFCSTQNFVSCGSLGRTLASKDTSLIASSIILFMALIARSWFSTGIVLQLCLVCVCVWEREIFFIMCTWYLFTRNSGTRPAYEFYHSWSKAVCTNKSFKLLFFLVAHTNWALFLG